MGWFLADHLQIYATGQSCVPIGREQAHIAEDVADHGSAGLKRNIQPLAQGCGQLFQLQGALDLDYLDDPVDEGSRRVLQILAQLPGLEMGQFEVCMGVDQAGEQRMTREFQNRRRYAPAEFVKSSYCLDNPVLKSYCA